MKYATWKLNFSDPSYGTGPEVEIATQGGTAEGAYTSSEGSAQSTIMGYFTGSPTGLDAWEFQEVSQAEALAFVKETYEDAFLLEDGRIGIPAPSNFF